MFVLDLESSVVEMIRNCGHTVTTFIIATSAMMENLFPVSMRHRFQDHDLTFVIARIIHPGINDCVERQQEICEIQVKLGSPCGY